MATVYVLRYDEYENQQVIDIYATREAAEDEIVRAALAGKGYGSVAIDDHEPRTTPRTELREGAEPTSLTEALRRTRVALDTV